jgi:hypothetical protein
VQHVQPRQVHVDDEALQAARLRRSVVEVNRPPGLVLGRLQLMPPSRTLRHIGQRRAPDQRRLSAGSRRRSYYRMSQLAGAKAFRRGATAGSSRPINSRGRPSDFGSWSGTAATQRPRQHTSDEVAYRSCAHPAPPTAPLRDSRGTLVRALLGTVPADLPNGATPGVRRDEVITHCVQSVGVPCASRIFSCSPSCSPSPP